MASFIKGLFEKKKDIKYGKGHKLGDAVQAEQENEARMRALREQQMQQHSSKPKSSAYQNEAARKAGEAALSRIQQQSQKAKVEKPTASNKADKELNELEKEMHKALELKEHYFGNNEKKIDLSTHQERVLFKSTVLGPNERYTKDEIEDRIGQTLVDQLDQEPLLIAVTLLFTANYKKQEKLDKCIETLCKYVENILKNPGDEKYRKIRIENAIFKENVYSIKYSDMVLKKAGFKPMSLPKRENENELDEHFVYDQEDLRPLEALKEALSLGQPILPELDRNIKIFKIRSSNANLNKFEIPNEFYNLGVEELKREMTRKNEALEKSGMLRTKAMRERDEQLELRRYNYCLIRVRFPDDLILQAVFKANERVEELYKLVQSSLEHDYLAFDLICHNLRLNNSTNVSVAASKVEHEETFAEAKLTPASLIIFRLLPDQATQNMSSYLKDELTRVLTYLE